MKFYLNDISIPRPVEFDHSDFEKQLIELENLLAKNQTLKQNFFISRSIGQSKIDEENTVRDILNKFADRDYEDLIFSWIDHSGPFIDHNKLWNLQYKFVFNGIDVTDSGLGAACLQMLTNNNCISYSFQGGIIDFAKTPLEVIQVQENVTKEQNIEVKNLWKIEQLVTEAENLKPEVRTWAQMFEMAREIYPNLIIGNIEDHPNLNQSTFKTSIRDQCLNYMGFLDNIMSVRNEYGPGSKQYNDLFELYFKGDDPIFRDESRENKRKFKNELTFKRKTGLSYKATWHSKKISQKFRLHFEWPIKKNQKKAEIFYFGLKITKK